MLKVNSYDIDGVIFMNDHYTGLAPANPQDVIITGRSYTHAEETYKMLHSRGIYNQVFFNKLSRTDSRYGRTASGLHKANVIQSLFELGIQVDLHFEDDPRQKAPMLKEFEKCNLKTKVVIVQSWDITHLDEYFEKNPNG